MVFYICFNAHFYWMPNVTSNIILYFISCYFLNWNGSKCSILEKYIIKKLNKNGLFPIPTWFLRKFLFNSVNKKKLWNIPNLEINFKGTEIVSTKTWFRWLIFKLIIISIELKRLVHDCTVRYTLFIPVIFIHRMPIDSIRKRLLANLL